MSHTPVVSLCTCLVITRGVIDVKKDCPVHGESISEGHPQRVITTDTVTGVQRERLTGPDKMNGDHYILDEQHNAVPCDLMTWARWFGNMTDRIIEKTTLPSCVVSTVFLGLNHQYGDGPPLIFETMVFGGPFDQEMDRYSTWDEAVAGHARMVEKVSADSHQGTK